MLFGWTASCEAIITENKLVYQRALIGTAFGFWKQLKARKLDVDRTSSSAAFKHELLLCSQQRGVPHSFYCGVGKHCSLTVSSKIRDECSVIIQYQEPIGVSKRHWRLRTSCARSPTGRHGVLNVWPKIWRCVCKSLVPLPIRMSWNAFLDLTRRHLAEVLHNAWVWGNR